MGFSGFILCSLIVTIVYLLGIILFINDHEDNKCEMTYMYEYPQFVHIKLDAHPKFEKYGLYAYSEGRFTYSARNMKFTGIPVLFIPGNAGSYRQVRSFASVSLRKSLDDRPGFHFDFFTVNLNDEFSGLNGGLLDEQTEYVNHSVHRILELYGSDSKNIILLGHSMGGVIARGLLTLLKDNVVPLIITLATPHSRPPLMLDAYMHNYYQRIQTANMTGNSTIVSLSGGYNDYMIAPFITHAKHLDNVHIFSPSVPLVWLPIDHLCILWCKQLVLVVTRGLFDAVDFNTKQISRDPQYLRAVFHHHLVKNNGIKIRKSLQSVHSTQSVTFMKGRGKWIENLQKQYTISLPDGVQEMQFHMIRILNDVDYRYLTILSLNLEVVEWVYACSATEVQGQHRICSEGIHLSHLSEIVPSIRYKRKMLKLDTLELKKNYTGVTHVIVRVLPTSKPVTIHVDRYFEPDRKLEVRLTPLLSFQRNVIVNETYEKALYYEITFPQLTHIMQSYKLDVQPINCNGRQYHATASLMVPWANQNIHKHFTEGDHNPFVVRLHSTRFSNGSATILLTLDPMCRYSVSVRYNILGSIAQITRIYTPLLLPNMVTVILLAFRNQLLGIEATKSCSMFFSAAQYGIKPYYLLPMVKIASRGLSWRGFSNFWIVPDWHVITEEGNDFFLLPLVLYMTSVGLVWLSGLLLASSLVLYEATFHKLACKFLARTVTGSQRLSDWVLSALHKLPGVVAIVLVVLSITTCGGLSLCIGCVFYFLKLIQMSQDYIEHLVLRMFKYFASKVRRKFSSDTNESECNEKSDENCVVKEVEEESSQSEADADERCVENQVQDLDVAAEGDSEVETEENTPKTVSENSQQSDCNGIFFHFSIFMLWCIIAGLNVPSVLTWAHNFKYNTVLQPDPSFAPGLILSICSLPLWHMDLPRINISGYSHLGKILTVLAAVTLIYSSVFLYRLNYVITITIVLITCHQVFAPKQGNSNDSDIGDNVTNETGSEPTINDIKSKLE